MKSVLRKTSSFTSLQVQPASNPPRLIFSLLVLLTAVGAAQVKPQQTPVVSLSSSTLNFGSILAGTTTVGQQVILTNIGDATLTIASVNGTDPNDFVLYRSCPASLAPGANCNFSVAFSPTGIGTLNGSVLISDNAPGSPQQVSLRGTVLQPNVQLSARSLDFGVVAVGSTSSAQTVTLTNAATTDLRNIVVTSGSGEFAETNTCPSLLAPGAACTITVTFSPGSGATRIATVTISDSDSSSPQLIGVTGTGASGSVSFSPASLTFANQKVNTTSPPQNVTVTNSGTANLQIFNIAASGDFAQTNTCSAPLLPGATCNLSVTFSPSATGARAGYLTVNDTDATNLQTVNLSGTGTVKQTTLSVKPKVASVNFTQNQNFQALENGLPTTNVTWYVDNIVGGNSSVGTISTSGLYTPPNTIGSHLVAATDNSDPTQTATVRIVITNFVGAFTYHYDNARTGLNKRETVLTTGNVNEFQFGKVFSYAVDGQIYAQPLYVPSVSIPGHGTHNVVYVTTEHDSVYAFDADGLVSTPLWQTSFIDPANGVTTIPASDIFPGGFCTSIGPEIGTTGTPVIDPSTNRLYLVVRTKEVSGGITSYPQRLHALDITTGAEIPGSPVLIQASVPGSGEGNEQGTISFDPIKHNSRAGLLLLNGVVYMTWSSPCDQHPYHGWLMGYDANSLQQVSVFNTSPNGDSGSLWAGGAGIPADSSGNIFLFTSNGDFTADSGGTDYSDSILKMSTSGGTLAVGDYFTPYNQNQLNANDYDLGGGGPLLLPDQPTAPSHLLVGAGKEGTVYLVDRDNMGHFNPRDDNHIQQSLFRAVGVLGAHDAFFGMPAYWNQQVFFWGASDVVKVFRLFGGLLSQQPISFGSITAQTPGPVPTISANVNANGIVWALQFRAKKTTILRAYDAANLSREIYDSAQMGSRDAPGLAVEFAVPTVANGKVYIGTQTELDVYGLLP